jgi:endonuclease/exonuclease/phosphatase family metal-dependent hydrolase
MTRPHFSSLLLLVVLLLLAGCGTPPEAAKPESSPLPPAPAPKKTEAPSTTFSVASINLAQFKGRIERADIDAFCRAIQREKPDVVAVQGMTRYPGVLTRIDPYPEIATGTGMRSVFGEMATLSGRQTGNALYSTLPIHSHESQPYPISSLGFEAALVGLIDAGAREVAVVSTLYPASAKAADQASCDAFLGRLRAAYDGAPVIVAGNLPEPPVGPEAYLAERSGGLRTWYSTDGLRPAGTRAVQTELGTLLVTQFRVFAKTAR